MSGIACQTDLYPGRNVYLTSCFILSVLFLKGSEMSHVTQISNSGSNHLPDQSGSFCLSWFMTGGEMSVFATHDHASPVTGTSTLSRNVYLTSFSFCLYMCGFPNHTDGPEYLVEP